MRAMSLSTGCSLRPALVDELVVGARLHAMRRGEQQIARDRGRGAGGAVGTEDHDHGTPGAVGRRRRAADHRRSAQPAAA